MASGDKCKFIGVVEDSFSKTSSNRNKYIKVLLTDEVGSLPGIMVDSKRKKTCTEYLDKGNEIPAKDSIVVIVGRKAEDVLFVDSMSIIDEKIFMKLGDIK